MGRKSVPVGKQVAPPGPAPLNSAEPRPVAPPSLLEPSPNGAAPQPCAPPNLLEPSRNGAAPQPCAPLGVLEPGLNSAEPRPCATPSLLEPSRNGAEPWTGAPHDLRVPCSNGGEVLAYAPADAAALSQMTSPALQSVQSERLKRVLRPLTPDEDRKIDQFIRQHFKWLTVLAARFVGWTDARDVVQNASVNLVRYIRAIPQQKSIELLAFDSGLRSLMYKITLRRAFDVLATRKRNKEDLATDEVSAEGDDATMLRSQAAIDIARLEPVYSAMPPVQRLAHILHHFYGFTARECAAMLSAALKRSHPEAKELTESGIETLISRATKALKHAMEMKS